MPRTAERGGQDLAGLICRSPLGGKAAAAVAAGLQNDARGGWGFNLRDVSLHSGFIHKAAGGQQLLSGKMLSRIGTRGYNGATVIRQVNLLGGTNDVVAV